MDKMKREGCMNEPAEDNFSSSLLSVYITNIYEMNTELSGYIIVPI